MQERAPVILVADDDAHVRHALHARLTQAGFDVVSAADGRQAIAALHRRRLDAALLDVCMPEVDGFGVCEHMRATPETADLPVIFLTGAEDGILQKNLGALTGLVGGNYFLSKPYDGAALLVMLRKATARG